MTVKDKTVKLQMNEPAELQAQVTLIDADHKPGDLVAIFRKAIRTTGFKPDAELMPEHVRRSQNKGFLYPNNHPFAWFEGNFTGTGYINWDDLMWGHKKIAKSEEDAASLEVRSPMMNRKNTEYSQAPGILRRN